MNDTAGAQPDWEARYASENTPWDRGAVNPVLNAWLERGRLPRGRALVPG